MYPSYDDPSTCSKGWLKPPSTLTLHLVDLTSGLFLPHSANVEVEGKEGPSFGMGEGGSSNYNHTPAAIYEERTAFCGFCIDRE